MKPMVYAPLCLRRMIPPWSSDATLNASITDVTAGGANDLVVMGDFVCGEPQPLA